MSDYEIKDLMRQIAIKTGIDIKERCRKRPNFYTRVVFLTMLKQSNPYMTLMKMGDLVGIDHSSVIHSLKTYKTLKKYDDFIDIELVVKAIQIENMIFCNPIPYLNDKI